MLPAHLQTSPQASRGSSNLRSLGSISGRNVSRRTEEDDRQEDYPINSAYASTYHKAQGQTLDDVFLTIGGPTLFYVGCSRARTRDGLHIMDMEAAEKTKDYCSRSKEEEKEQEETCCGNCCHLTAFNGWNPIVHGITLASYVMFVLKHEYMKDGDIGYVPEGGYGKDNNSTIALKYIQWLQKKNPFLDLQYHLKGGEKMIEAAGHSYFADAYDEATKTVYEVNGCVWHGCERRYNNQDLPSTQDPSITYGALRKRTAERAENIKNAGYNIVEVWECDIKRMLNKDRSMNKFFELCKYDRRLQPREALYGGRTQVFRSSARRNNQYQLDYLDFVSMYPYVLYVLRDRCILESN